jgi:virulence-associated protein VagC/TfoX/Sxy family transcriptional regulator of competence genes
MRVLDLLTQEGTTMAVGKVYNLGSYQAVRFPRDFRAELGEYEIRRDGDELILHKVTRTDSQKLAILRGHTPGGRSMAKKKTSSAPADKLALYDKLIATDTKIERKGATMPYTAVNGNMFTLLDPSGTLALRLDEAERQKFLKKYKTKLFEAYGTVMKEYVTVPDTLLKNTKELYKYLELSHEYVKTLKPKPSKKA